jgi:hypothetical protein
MSEFLYSDKWFQAKSKLMLRPNGRQQWKDAPMWLRIVWMVAIVNFASFDILALLNGGDALNGKQELGKYFLGGRGHHYIEVSKIFFQFSAIQAYSVCIIFAAALFGHFFWTRKHAKRT